MNKLNSVVSVITPQDIGEDLIGWTEDGKSKICEDMKDHIAILFRGFDSSGSDGFLKKFSRIFSEPIDYMYRSTPRTQQEQGVYTATEYPSDSIIPQHCECAYHSAWPLRLFFQCKKPASSGGETPLCDMRKVTKLIPQDIQLKFKKHGVMYIRNYKENMDLPWQVVFQTNHKEEVDQFCNRNNIVTKWSGNELRTEQICQAMALHPIYGDEIWFNQAHLFHFTSLDKEIQDFLVKMYGDDGLPRNSYYGNGEPIEADVLDLIRQSYVNCKCEFSWETNDILMLDNMLCAHGRNTYSGERRVLVAMNELVENFEFRK